jgi:hypothetical protein
MLFPPMGGPLVTEDLGEEGLEVIVDSVLGFLYA